MARDRITTTITGRDDIFKDLDLLTREFPVWVKQSFQAQQKVVEDKIRSNYLSAGGTSGDYIYDSIGSSVNYGSNKLDVIGITGVFNLNSVALAHGRVIVDGSAGYKPMNAAQIAYWMEFGTSRLKSGGRKKKNTQYDEEDLITTSPKPFISSSFYSTIELQEKAFSDEWNSLMTRMLK